MVHEFMNIINPLPTGSTCRAKRRPSQSGRGRRRQVQAIVAILLLALISRAAVAQITDQMATINREYSIKAAFLYHFATYVEWPAQALADKEQPFVIGLLHSDPFGATLAQIAQTKTVAGHPIEVRTLKSTEGMEHCHLLFISKLATPEQQAAALRAARQSTVLVVGEVEGFIDRGGDVQFYLEGNKVRFAFSAELAKRQDLKVSSKLLALAKIVGER